MSIFVTDRTARQLRDAGAVPINFHIGSEGDFEHAWEHEGQALMTASGDPFEEFIDPLENVVHRAWKQVSHLGSDLWRFYATVGYENGCPIGYTLKLEVEYILDDKQIAALKQYCADYREMVFSKVSLALSEAEFEDMHAAWDHPGKTQIAVWFDVRAMSTGEIAHLQAQWLLETRRITDDSFVSVL